MVYKFLCFKRFDWILQHIPYSSRMLSNPFKINKLHSHVFFFIISCKEVHLIVSVGPSLLFGGLGDAFYLLLLLSFALFSSLRSIFSKDTRIFVRYNDIPRSNRQLRNHFSKQRLTTNNLLYCNTFKHTNISQVDTFLAVQIG